MNLDIKKIFDRLEPTFSKGGKLGALHSTFDAFETFFFVPKTVTKSGSHIRDCVDMKRMMIVVVIALMPALLFGMFNVGYQVHGNEFSWIHNWWYGFYHVLPIILVSYIVGLAIEFTAAQMRGHEVNEGFLVTGLLIPMIVPVGTPLWMIAIATAFSVIVCKEMFGGTGMNVFNPALVARVFIFFSYTSKISGETVWYADAHSGATALGQLSDTGANAFSMMDAFWGTIPGCIGETSKLCILLGAILLLYTGVASWRTMVSVFAGGLVMGLIFNLIAPANPQTASEMYMAMPAWQHLMLGGFAFGAVFMATDPVTSAQTNAGKWITGTLIGMLAVLTRVVNAGYPEGMMLAILFMNGVAPLIDHYVVQTNVKRRQRKAKKMEALCNE